VNNGISPYMDENDLPELIAKVSANGKLKASNKLEDSFNCEIYIIAVPTLIRGQRPDIDVVELVGRDLAINVRRGCLIVLQSTVPPGTAERVLGKFDTPSGLLKAGVDYGLCYSPERTQMPQVLHDLKKYPKIIGGIDKKSTSILSQIYGTFAPRIIKMNSLAAAELDKVVENTYRDVNIAFANELAQICEIYEVDVHEIISAANSQPYSHILNPGLVGGHCIPMDPYYIISDLLEKGYYPKLIKAARDLNESMFKNIIGMIDDNTQVIAILGLSFKKDVKSFDTSHTIKLIKMLREYGKEVIVHDPFITNDEHFDFNTKRDIYSTCTGADCLIVSTAHSEYETLDLNKLKKVMKGNLIIDVRNLFIPEKVRNAGFKYYGLGNKL